MIIEQNPYIDKSGKSHNNLIYHYSSEGKKIKQNETLIEYDEAIDVIPCQFTYTEID